MAAYMVNIRGLDKARVLKALFDAALPPNAARQTPSSTGTMPLEEAARRISVSTYFSVIWGKKLEVDLSGNSFDATGYDAANGMGQAKRAIKALYRPKRR